MHHYARVHQAKSVMVHAKPATIKLPIETTLDNDALPLTAAFAGAFDEVDALDELLEDDGELAAVTTTTAGAEVVAGTTFNALETDGTVALLAPAAP